MRKPNAYNSWAISERVQVAPPGHLDINYLRLREKVHQLYERGFDNCEIAEKVGLTTLHVRRYLKMRKPIIPRQPANHAWREDASCKAEDTNIFFPNATGMKSVNLKKQAMKICSTCPVINECRDAAMKNFEVHGIWAGEDFSKYFYGFDESTGKVTVSVRGDCGTLKKVC